MYFLGSTTRSPGIYSLLHLSFQLRNTASVNAEVYEIWVLLCRAKGLLGWKFGRVGAEGFGAICEGVKFEGVHISSK